MVSLILIYWIVTYPVDSAIQRLNNQGYNGKLQLIMVWSLCVCIWQHCKIRLALVVNSVKLDLTAWYSSNTVAEMIVKLFFCCSCHTLNIFLAVPFSGINPVNCLVLCFRKIHQWSIINAAFWLVELLLGYLL